MHEDDPMDATARQQARETKARAQRQRQSVADDDFKLLMGKSWGRRIVWGLLQDAGVFRISFDPDSERRTAFAEGNRNYGLRVFKRVMALCPEQFMVMERENDDLNRDTPQSTRRTAQPNGSDSGE